MIPTQALLAVAICISFFYVIEDIFNHRTISYKTIAGTMLLGAIAMVLAYPLSEMLIGILVASACCVGAILINIFKLQDKIGAADFWMLATLSLVIPMQPAPILLHITQPNLPFLLSIFPASLVAFGFEIVIYRLARSKEENLPFCPAILAGVVISLLFGNLLVLLV